MTMDSMSSIHSMLWSWVALAGLGAFHGLNPGMGWLFAVALGMQEGHRRAVWRALVPLGLGHLLAVGSVLALAALSGLVVPEHLLRAIVCGLLIGLGAYRLVRHRHPRWGGMRVSMTGLTMWSFLMASAHGAGLMVLPIVMTAAPHHHAQTAHAMPGHVTPGHDMPGHDMPGHGMPGHTMQAHAMHADTTHIQTMHAHAAASSTASAAAATTAAASASTGAVTAPVTAPLMTIAATAVHTAGYLIAAAFVAWIVFERLGLGLLRRAWINLDLVWAGALVATGLLALW
jgi:hypothetical protein